MPEVNIHPTALVDDSADLGEGVSVGPFAIIDAGVSVGDRSRIDSHVLLAGGTRLGAECHVFKGAVLGTEPQDLKFKGEPSEVIVGDRTVIREFCTIHRGTEQAQRKTVIGCDCFLMAYVHVAHDCTLGSGIILANAVNMGGHVEIDDYANVGGMTAIHQFVKIGKYSFIGGRSRVAQDVPPYVLTAGEPMEYHGPNVVGLKRRGFTASQIAVIKKAYHLIYRTEMNIPQALEAIRSEFEPAPEIDEIIGFLSRADRGIVGK